MDDKQKDRRRMAHKDGEWSDATRRAYVARVEEARRAAHADMTLAEWRARERAADGEHDPDTEF